MTEGVDYAFTKPSAQALVNADKHFAGRYIGPGTDDKHLHATERDSLFAHGIDIFLLVEGAANGALGGFSTGVGHAKSAETARLALGASALPLYFAVDFDVTSLQWPTVRSYLIGAGSVIGKSRVGIYGGIRAMQWASADGVASWFFQTFAWSAGRWFPGNHVEQYENDVTIDGASCDLCRANKVNFGQWSLRGAPNVGVNNEMGYFFSEANGSQYFADSSFERYWAFTGDGTWDAVHAAAGSPPAPVVDGKMIAAGAFGQYQGIYTLPRAPHTPGPAPSPGNYTISFTGSGTANPS